MLRWLRSDYDVVRIKLLFRFVLYEATPILNLLIVADFPMATKFQSGYKPHAYLAIVGVSFFINLSFYFLYVDYFIFSFQVLQLA